MKINLTIVQTVVTTDGSVTLFRPDLNETYHSRHGAINESRHVFVEAGLNYALPNKMELRILEMGFGTGLNVLLTAMETKNSSAKIFFTSIEKFPLENEVYKNINYASILNEDECWNKIINSEWNQWCNIHNRFILYKAESSIEDFLLPELVDLIYYDAFAPGVQPELWTITQFEKMASLLNQDGVLVTYCAKGEVKRNLKAAGFIVETLKGPPGKREMIRAIKA